MSYVDGDKLFDLSAAAAYFGVNYMTMWRWVKSGKIAATMTPAGQWRISGKTINEQLENAENRAAQGVPV